MKCTCAALGADRLRLHSVHPGVRSGASEVRPLAPGPMKVCGSCLRATNVHGDLGCYLIQPWHAFWPADWDRCGFCGCTAQEHRYCVYPGRCRQCECPGFLYVPEVTRRVEVLPETYHYVSDLWGWRAARIVAEEGAAQIGRRRPVVVVKRSLGGLKVGGDKASGYPFMMHSYEIHSGLDSREPLGDVYLRAFEETAVLWFHRIDPPVGEEQAHSLAFQRTYSEPPSETPVAPRWEAAETLVLLANIGRAIALAFEDPVVLRGALLELD